MTGLSCRSCGGPLAVSLAAPCPACGAPPEVDPAVRARLWDHAARVAAAWQEVRAVVGYRLIIASAQGAGCWRGLALVSAVAVPFALSGGLALVLMAFVFTAPMGFVCMLATALGFFPAEIAAVVGLSVVRRARAAEGAKVELAKLAPPADTSCSSCGAHSRVLGMGPWPCPYCETPLVPPPEATVTAEERLTELAAHHRALADQLAGQVYPASPWPNGWSWHYGVVTGEVSGVPLWGGEDLYEGAAVLLYRLEAPGTPGLVVHQDHEERYRALAADVGVPWPEHDRVELGGGWVGYGSPLERPRTLGRGELLFRDNAGLHWWRFDTLRNTTFRGMRHHGPRVGALLGKAHEGSGGA